MSEPIRHSATLRNERKMRHQIEVLCEELEYLLAENVKVRVNIHYAYSKACKLRNRMKAKP